MESAVGSRSSTFPFLSGESRHLVLPGDVVTNKSSGYMQGKGIYTDEENKCMIASVRGYVQNIDKLIYVQTMKNKYAPKVGDVLVGRVTEIINGKWVVDIGMGSRAELPMCNVYVNELAQRRKTYDDIKCMRSILKENDLISCDVQRISNSSSAENSSYSSNVVVLQIRTKLFGKLGDTGSLIKVSPGLIQRLNKHMLFIKDDVYLILGCNGYIFISASCFSNNGNRQTSSKRTNEVCDSENLYLFSGRKKKFQEDFQSAGATHEQDSKSNPYEAATSYIQLKKHQATRSYMDLSENEQDLDLEATENDVESSFYQISNVDVYKRINIARVRNSILLLSSYYINITPDTILLIFNITVNNNIKIFDILKNKYSFFILKEFKNQQLEILNNSEKKT